MIARAMPFAGIASRKAVASSGGIGFVLRSIRGLREKIWIASHPIFLPAIGAFANPPAIETCAPRSIAGGNRRGREKIWVEFGRSGLRGVRAWNPVMAYVADVDSKLGWMFFLVRSG